MSIASFASARSARLAKLRAQYATPPPPAAAGQEQEQEEEDRERLGPAGPAAGPAGEQRESRERERGESLSAAAAAAAPPPPEFSFPAQRAVPWPLNPLVKNIAITLPAVDVLLPHEALRAALKGAAAAASLKSPPPRAPTSSSKSAKEDAKSGPLWVVSLWQTQRRGHPASSSSFNSSFSSSSPAAAAATAAATVDTATYSSSRVSANVEVDAGAASSVVFANARAGADVLRVQLRSAGAGSPVVLLQGAVRIAPAAASSNTTSEVRRGSCVSESQCRVQLGGSGDLAAGVALNLCVTSFWHRWGHGSDRAVVDAARGMRLAWISPDSTSSSSSSSSSSSPSPGGGQQLSSSSPTSSNLLDETGVQRLLRTASENPDPTMVLDLVRRLLARTSLASLQRNAGLITDALAAVWRRSRSHQPGVAVVVQITDAFASMIMRLLGDDNTSTDQNANNNRSNNSNMNAEFGRQRARAVQLLETVVWAGTPAEMLVTTLQTTLDRVIIALQRASHDANPASPPSAASKANTARGAVRSPMASVLAACRHLEVVCVMLAVGDSSRAHADKLMASPGDRSRWDAVAAKVLPVLTASARHLELFATIEQASLAAMSLLRGLAAVVPPLLSRASPKSVAKHIAAFMSTLPLRALNPAAMETTVAFLSNVYEPGYASSDASASPAPSDASTSLSYANSTVTETGLRIAAVELLGPTVALLHRLAEAALPQREGNAVSGVTTAVANSACVPSSWPSTAALLARAFDLAISAEKAEDDRMRDANEQKAGAAAAASLSSEDTSVTPLLMGLLDVSQELLSIVGGENAAQCLHHQGFCAVLMSGLESLLHGNPEAVAAAETTTPPPPPSSSSPFADACARMDPSRRTSVITGLLHVMKCAIDSRASISHHMALVWALDHHEAASAFSPPSVDLISVAKLYGQLMPPLRATTSSVVEEASLNAAKLALAMTILAKITQGLPSAAAGKNGPALQSDEGMSNILRAAQHWVCVIQQELHKPDMSFLDPRTSSSASATTMVAELLSAGLSCCLALRYQNLPRYLRPPLHSLAQNCVECAVASLVSGPGSSGHFAARGADRERASRMLAWFQDKLERASTSPEQESAPAKHRRKHAQRALDELSAMAFASIEMRQQFVPPSSSRSQLWEVNDGATALSDRLTWEEVFTALGCFYDFVPVLCNVEVGKGGASVSVSDPQEHRLAEALSKILVWWSRVEPTLALPYADGLVRLHQATGNNHARVLSLVAKARLTGALVTQKSLPWHVYATSALAAASAVRAAKISDATALDLCRHAHRHMYGSGTNSAKEMLTLHERLLSTSESILDDLHEKRIDHVTSLETASCWFAVRMSDPDELEEHARGSGSSWFVYRHDAWVSTEDFIAELRESYPTHRILTPSHPVPRPALRQATGARSRAAAAGSVGETAQPINHYYKATLSTLLPEAKEMQVFVCHPESTGSKAGLAEDNADADDEWGDPDEGKISVLQAATAEQDQEDQGETFVLYAFVLDRGNDMTDAIGGANGGNSFQGRPRTPSRSYHKPIRHSSFGKTPTSWHKSDGELDGQTVRVALHVHSGKVLRGLCRRQRASSVVMRDMSSTEACNEWIIRQKRRIHDFMRILEGSHASPDEEDLKSVLVELEKMMSHVDTTSVSLAVALRLIVYYREWEEGYQKKTGNELKRTWIREKRKNEKEGLPPPPKPNFAAIVQAEKNLPVERLVKLFTGMVTGLDDALDVIESEYGLDVEHCRSLLSSIYGADVGEDLTKLENDLWKEEHRDPTDW